MDIHKKTAAPIPTVMVVLWQKRMILDLGRPQSDDAQP
jgi:hypothetical protein